MRTSVGAPMRDIGAETRCSSAHGHFGPPGLCQTHRVGTAQATYPKRVMTRAITIRFQKNVVNCQAKAGCIPLPGKALRPILLCLRTVVSLNRYLEPSRIRATHGRANGSNKRISCGYCLAPKHRRLLTDPYRAVGKAACQATADALFLERLAARRKGMTASGFWFVATLRRMGLTERYCLTLPGGVVCGQRDERSSRKRASYRDRRGRQWLT